jgi:hypothetical protein
MGESCVQGQSKSPDHNKWLCTAKELTGYGSTHAWFAVFSTRQSDDLRNGCKMSCFSEFARFHQTRSASASAKLNPVLRVYVAVCYW